MLAFGIVCALVATASAGYASSSSGAGLYNSNSYGDQNYGSKYPYTNKYTGTYSGGSVGGGGGYYQPAPPFASPYDFQQAFANYYNQLSAFNANLFQQQLAHQNAIFNSIRNQAYGGAGGFPAGGGFGGAGGFAGGYGGASAGSFGGASTGTYGGVGPSGGSYGGTYGGGNYAPNRGSYEPNYASAGGFVSSGGHQQQHASIYPENPGRPNLDTRFSDDSAPGVTITQGNPGFVGVSSFSSSSDINGHKHRESATSVNNNGKVTTYHTRN